MADDTNLTVFDAQKLNSDLIRYYTELVNQHRQDINFYLGLFFAISQILILTPENIIEKVRDFQGTAASLSHIMSVIGLSSLILLLLIGLGHHICNFISANTCRIRHETYLVKDLLDSTSESINQDIERSVRPNISISKITGPMTLLFGGILYLITVIQFFNIVDTFLAMHPHWSLYVTNTCFTLFNMGSIGFFVYVGTCRLKQFYVAQGVLGLTRDLANENRIREFVSKHKITS